MAFVSLIAACVIALGSFFSPVSGEYVPEPDEFVILVDLETEDEVRVLGYEYSLDGVSAGGGQSWEAGMNEALTGTQYLIFSREDLPVGAASKHFSLALFLADSFDAAWDDTHGHDLPVSGEIDLPVAFGEARRVKVTGSGETGYTARVVP